jgi:hypothetical protein
VNGHLAPYLLAQSAVPSSVTGTTAETVLATIAIPAGAVSANGALRVTTLWSVTNNANTKVGNLRLSGANFGIVTLASVASGQAISMVRNRNSVTSQVGSAPANMGSGTNGSGTWTGSIDMSQAQSLTLTGTLANASDSATLESYTVEILNP